MEKEKIKKEGDTVKYKGEEYLVTFVFNHGGKMVYYDLESKENIPFTNVKRTQLSVLHSELEN